MSCKDCNNCNCDIERKRLVHKATLALIENLGVGEFEYGLAKEEVEKWTEEEMIKEIKYYEERNK